MTEAVAPTATPDPICDGSSVKVEPSGTASTWRPSTSATFVSLTVALNTTDVSPVGCPTTSAVVPLLLNCARAIGGWGATGPTTRTTVLSAAPPGAVTTIIVVPGESAVTRPVPSTEATLPVRLAHAKVTPSTETPWASRACAPSCPVLPRSMIVRFLGDTATVAPRMPRRIVPPRPTTYTLPYDDPQMPRRWLPVPLAIVTQ